MPRETIAYFDASEMLDRIFSFRFPPSSRFTDANPDYPALKKIRRCPESTAETTQVGTR